MYNDIYALVMVSVSVALDWTRRSVGHSQTLLKVRLPKSGSDFPITSENNVTCRYLYNRNYTLYRHCKRDYRNIMFISYNNGLIFFLGSRRFTNDM